MLNQLLVKDMRGLHILCEHMLNSLDKSTAAVFWKDKKSRYIGVNKAFLNCAGVNSDADVIGKTDKDLRWGKYAKTIMENDSKVVYTGVPTKFIELCRIGDDDYYVNYKTPLSPSSKITGVLGVAIPLKKQKTLLATPFNLNCFNTYNDSNLTKRQQKCLYYLTQGMNAKEIARVLNLSHRTIEKYIELLKQKWNCHSKSQLIQKAIEYQKDQYLLNNLVNFFPTLY